VDSYYFIPRKRMHLLWPPYVIGRPLYFCPVVSFYLSGSLRHPCKFQRVSRLGNVTARHSSSGRQPNCGVEQRAPPIFGRASITLGTGSHF